MSSSSNETILFQTTLQDLVKGIRGHKKDISLYISQKIVEIKNELRSTDTYIKAEAVSLKFVIKISKNEHFFKSKIIIYRFGKLHICR